MPASVKRCNFRGFKKQLEGEHKAICCVGSRDACLDQPMVFSHVISRFIHSRHDHHQMVLFCARRETTDEFRKNASLAKCVKTICAIDLLLLGFLVRFFYVVAAFRSTVRTTSMYLSTVCKYGVCLTLLNVSWTTSRQALILRYWCRRCRTSILLSLKDCYSCLCSLKFIIYRYCSKTNENQAAAKTGSCLKRTYSAPLFHQSGSIALSACSIDRCNFCDVYANVVHRTIE